MELLMAELPMLALIFVKNLRPGTGLRQIYFHQQDACYAAVRAFLRGKNVVKTS